MRSIVLVVAAAVLGCGSKSDPPKSRFEISRPSAASVTARKAIDGEVSVLVFVDDTQLADQVVGYLEDLGKQSGRPFAIRELDRLTDVEKATQYKVVDNAVVFVRGDRSSRIGVYDGMFAGSNDNVRVERFDRDVAVTLGSLGQKSPTVEIVLGGDDGPNRYTMLEKLVKDWRFKLVATGEQPQIMIVIDRGTGSLDEALARVDAHVAAGGAALIALEPVAGHSLGALEKRLGIRFAAQPLLDDKAFVRASGTVADYRNIATNDFASHPATAAASRNAQAAAVFVTAGSLEIDSAAKPAPTVFIRTGNSSFVDEDGNGTFDPAEKRRSYALAAATELAPQTPGKGRVIVYADADWFSDRVIAQVASHQLLAYNALRWLGVQAELDLPPLPDAKPGSVELTRYPLRSHATKPAAVAKAGLWEESADAIQTVTLTTKEQVVSIARKSDGLWGRDERVPAGSATPVAREYPIDDQAGRDMLATLAKPQSLRSLGTLDDARKQEFGLDGAEVLVVKGRATHELVLGGRVYGGADRYALDRTTGEGHVLAYRTLSKLLIGEAGLRLRTFVPFGPAETARVVVELGGTKRELPVGDPIKSPAGSHEALGALIANDAHQLRAIDFVADAQAGALSHIARVTLASKTGATAELELLTSAGDGRVYVRGPRGLGKVSAGADHLVHTIEQAIATPP